MDDLEENIFEVWKLRLRMERVKEKVLAIEWELESDEYKEVHGEDAYQKAKNALDELKKEYSEIDRVQYQLEDKIKLPNPYLKQPN